MLDFHRSKEVIEEGYWKVQKIIWELKVKLFS